MYYCSKRDNRRTGYKAFELSEETLAYYIHIVSMFLLRDVCLEIHVVLDLAQQLFRSKNMQRACVV